MTFMKTLAPKLGNRKWRLAYHCYPPDLLSPVISSDDYPIISFGNINQSEENIFVLLTSKASLVNTYRQVLLHPNANVNNILNLIKLDIPVTDNNIIQYECYKNIYCTEYNKNLCLGFNAANEISLFDCKNSFSLSFKLLHSFSGLFLWASPTAKSINSL